MAKVHVRHSSVRFGAISSLCAVLFLCASALAQSGVGVSPGRVELYAQRGTAVTQVLTVDNPSATDSLDVTAYLNDIMLAPDGSLLYLEAGTNPRSLSPWTTVNPLTFSLQPGAAIEVSYQVSIPEDTADGTYWGIIFFESKAGQSTESTQGGIGVTTFVRIGHIVYVTVGESTQQGSIADIRFDSTSQPGAVRVTFQNDGNALMRLNGRVEVRLPTGDLMQVLTLQGIASFPGATHDIAVPLLEPLESGEYVVLAVLDYGQATVIAGEGRVEVP